MYFQLLRDLLGAEKAILLRRVQSLGQLLPYLSIGFSTTTIANLRVDPVVAQGVLGGNSFAVFASLPDFVKPFFSLTDSDVEQSVLVCGITIGEQIEGLFIWVDNPYATIPRAHIELVFAPIRDMVARFIGSGFGDEMLPAHHFLTNLRTLSENGESRARIQTFDPGSVVSIDFNDVISLLTKNYQFLTGEAALRDLSTTIHKTCADFPMIQIRTETNMYLVFQTSNPIPAKILAMLLATKLSLSFFGTDEYISQISGFVREMKFGEFSDTVLGQVSL